MWLIIIIGVGVIIWIETDKKKKEKNCLKILILIAPSETVAIPFGLKCIEAKILSIIPEKSYNYVPPNRPIDANNNSFHTN